MLMTDISAVCLNEPIFGSISVGVTNATNSMQGKCLNYLKTAIHIRLDV
jgi:hypothetical protein